MLLGGTGYVCLGSVHFHRLEEVQKAQVKGDKVALLDAGFLHGLVDEPLQIGGGAEELVEHPAIRVFVLDFFRQVGNEVEEPVSMVFPVVLLKPGPVVGKPEEGYTVEPAADIGWRDSPVYLIGLQICFKMESFIMIQVKAAVVLLRENVSGDKAAQPVGKTCKFGVLRHIDDDSRRISSV